MNKKLYDFAIYYINKGFCPIPVWPDRRKNPRLSSILEYRERLPRHDEWQRWSSAFPKSNLALLTGHHGNLCALDFDSIGDYNAWHIGVSPQWRNTWTVETGRGKHVYFVAQGDPGKDRVFTLNHHHVLLRAKGAYTIAPPSIHYSGKPYRTITKAPPVTCQVRYILAGWKEKQPTKPDKPARPPAPAPAGNNSAKRPSIIDYIPPYSKKPNRRGAYQCFCPFHDDETPSAWVNPEQNRFGCNSDNCEVGKVGWLDVINVIARLKGYDNNQLMQNLYHRGDALKFESK